MQVGLTVARRRCISPILVGIEKGSAAIVSDPGRRLVRPCCISGREQRPSVGHRQQRERHCENEARHPRGPAEPTRPRPRNPTRLLSRTQDNHHCSSLPQCLLSSCARQPEASLKISPPHALSRRPRDLSADLAPPRITHGEDMGPDRRPHARAAPSNRVPRHSAFLQKQLRSVRTGSSTTRRMSRWRVAPPISEGWGHHLLRGPGEVRSVITPAPPAGQHRPSDGVRRVVSHADSSPRHSLSETTVLVLLV